MPLWAVILVANLLALAAASGLLVGGLWIAGFPKLQHDDAVQANTIFEMIKISLAVVAGVGGVVALVVAYRRQRVMEIGNARSDREDARNHTRLQEERFARASEEMGSEKPAVQLAGIYAMAALADDWPEGRQRCIEVLCAFVRLPPRLSQDDAEIKKIRLGHVTRTRMVGREDHAEAARAGRETTEVRATVIRLIARHLRLGADVSWCGMDFDFTGALIDRADFTDCVFSSGMISFREATFAPGLVRFDRSQFSGATVAFSGATFNNVGLTFFDARFEAGQISFGSTKLNDSRIRMRRSDFSGGRLAFGDACLGGASRLDFIECEFRDDAEIFLGHVTLAGGSVAFQNSHFRGYPIELKNARVNHGKLEIRECEFSGSSGFNLADSMVGDGGLIALSKLELSGRRASLAHIRTAGGRVVIEDVAIRNCVLSFVNAKFASGTVLMKKLTFGDSGTLNLRFRYLEGAVFLADWHAGIPPEVRCRRSRLILEPSESNPGLLQLRLPKRVKPTSGEPEQPAEAVPSTASNDDSSQASP